MGRAPADSAARQRHSCDIVLLRVAYAVIGLLKRVGMARWPGMVPSTLPRGVNNVPTSTSRVNFTLDGLAPSRTIVIRSIAMAFAVNVVASRGAFTSFIGVTNARTRLSAISRTRAEMHAIALNNDIAARSCAQLQGHARKY